MNFGGAAAAILAAQGEAVVLRRGGAETPLRAVVTDHGLCPPPPGWPGPVFSHVAEHAEFRFDASQVDPARGDLILWSGREYGVRQVLPEPRSLPSAPLWRVCRAAAQQRGKY